MTNLFAVLRWSLSLGVKFYRVVPRLTLTIVFLTILAQISSLLSFFLPLKIVIILGSEGIPRYLPPVFTQFDRDWLILGLSSATAGFFLLSLLANKLIERAISVGAVKLLGKSQKLVLFENQNDVAANGYMRYSSAMASGVFIGVALVVLGWFYLSMVALIVVYVVLTFLLLLGLNQKHEGFRDYLDKNLSAILSLTSNLGFFVVFAYLVVEFVFLSPPGFVIGIISIIVSRQIFGRTAALVIAITGLVRQRPKLDALFFHSKVFLVPQPQVGKKDLWSLLSLESRNTWIENVLKEAGVHGLRSPKLNVTWMDCSQPNMPNLLVSSPEQTGEYYLLKLFDCNRKSLAQHEATLATVKHAGLPMPILILATEVDRFACHVYKLLPGKLLEPKAVTSELPALEAQLFGLSLPANLVNRYLRSRPVLGERLTKPVLELLYVAADDHTDTRRVAEVVERIPEIRARLQALPLILFNPNLKTSVWMNGEDKSFSVLNWSGWSLEPLGAGWFSAGKNMKLLAWHIELEAKQSGKLAKIDPELAQLSALVYELERLLKRQCFSAALSLLPRILNKLNTLQKKYCED
jgi:hypothetical protein